MHKIVKRILKVAGIICLALLVILAVLVIVVLNTDDETASYEGPSDNTVHTYSVAEINRLTGGTLSVGKTYETYFIPYSDSYSLTKEENDIIGNWKVIENLPDKVSFPDFTFYPNHFFIGFNDYSWYKFSKVMYLSDLYGIWSINNKELSVTVYGYVVYDISMENAIYYYKRVKPYTVKLIDLNFMAKDGYMQIPFYVIPIPEEIRTQIHKGGICATNVHCYRNIYDVYAVGTTGLNFGMLSYIPYMAKNSITAEMLVQNSKLMDYIFSDIYNPPFVYTAKNEKNPEKYPSLKQ